MVLFDPKTGILFAGTNNNNWKTIDAWLREQAESFENTTKWLQQQEQEPDEPDVPDAPKEQNPNNCVRKKGNVACLKKCDLLGACSGKCSSHCSNECACNAETACEKKKRWSQSRCVRDCNDSGKCK